MNPASNREISIEAIVYVQLRFTAHSPVERSATHATQLSPPENPTNSISLCPSSDSTIATFPTQGAALVITICDLLFKAVDGFM